MAITRGAHPKALWPGIFKWFGLKYDEYPTEYTDLFETIKSKKQYEELVNSTGFGYAARKNEGAPVTYDTHSQGWIQRVQHVAYALGYIVTKEEMDDNLYDELSRARAASLAFSLRQTKEVNGANIFNRAFSSSYTGGDGKALLATDHPTRSGGTYSNKLAVDADLSEAALEDIAIQISKAINDRGLKISLKPKALHVAPDNMFRAERILKSSLQSGTANNDLNALKAMNVFPGGIKVNHYFTDADAWFVSTNVPSRTGLIHFQRNAVEFSQDNDFDTMNARAKGYERYSFDWGDPRALYGSQGG